MTQNRNKTLVGIPMPPTDGHFPFLLMTKREKGSKRSEQESLKNEKIINSLRNFFFVDSDE